MPKLQKGSKQYRCDRIRAVSTGKKQAVQEGNRQYRQYGCEERPVEGRWSGHATRYRVGLAFCRERWEKEEGGPCDDGMSPKDS